MLKILIIEDSKEKLEIILEKVSPLLGERNIIIKECVNEAKLELRNTQFDLLILDVQLPIMRGDTPNKEAGINLLREIKIRSKKLKTPMETIVITEYEESYKKHREELDLKLTNFIKYDRTSIAWSIQLFEKVTEQISKKRSSLKQKIVVFTVHGFNTRGDWKNKFTSILSSDDRVEFIHYPWDYGTFMLKILNPFQRKKVIEKFHDFFNSSMSRHKEEKPKVCLVAHSFGTYIIAHALDRFPEIKFENMIFCGSPLKWKFEWKEIEKHKKVKRLLFYKSNGDFTTNIAPIIFGGKSSGKYGFVKDYKFIKYREFTKLGHSDMFGENHMLEEWVPFLKK